MNDKTHEASKEQVAKYLYYIAILIYTDFGPSGYLEHESMIVRLEKHLRCSAECYEHNKKSFLNERTEITMLVMKEIDANRPLMSYCDNGKDFSHKAGIDGYNQQKNSFLEHLNEENN